MCPSDWGYIAFGGSGGNSGGLEFSDAYEQSLPSFFDGGFSINTDNTSLIRNNGYIAMDDPSNGIGSDIANFSSTAILVQNQSSVGSGEWGELLSFTIDDTASSFRLGIIAGANDVGYDPAGFRLSFNGGGGAEVTSVLGDSSTLGAVFFDVTILNGSVGTFTLETLEGSNNAAISAVTFDLYSEELTTITYDFDDADGVVDANTFGLDVSAGDWTFDVDEGESAFQFGRAEAGVRTDGDDPTPYPVMRFDVTIPAGVSVDLTDLSFDHGFNDTHVNDITPYWELSISTGSASPSTNSLGTGTVDGDGYFVQTELLSLSGLNDLTDTTVTFEFTFRTEEDRKNDLDRAHTMDNVVLLGTVEEIVPVPVISDFSADAIVVDAGESVILSWEVDGAETLSIDSGVGFVSPVDVGSTEVVVDEGTTYTLTASNEYGVSTAEATVHLHPSVPNILLIIVDDMGTEDTSVDFNYDASGNVLDPVDQVSVGLPEWSDNPSDDPTNDPGGNAHFRTPAMERLAATGIKFSRAYAMQVCSPARCSLMTGQNAARHGTIQWLGRKNDSLHNIKMPANPGLTAANRTLAEEFRDAGYRTIIAGKGHIGDDYTANAGIYETASTDRSDDYYGFQINVSASDGGSHGDCYSNDDTAFGLNASGSTASIVAEYQDMTYHELDPETYPADSSFADKPVFVTEAITREMIERIETSVRDNVPFFADLSHFAMHAPHQVDPRFMANYPQFPVEDEYDDSAEYFLPLAYATMIEGMDQSVADVLAKLEELGIAENTLVIFTSDNGSDYRPRGPQDPPTLTGTNPLRGEKGNHYEGGLRVPLIVSWANPDDSNSFQQELAIPSGGRDDHIVALQDLYPTLLSIAGIPLPTVDDNGDPLVLDGYDIRPYICGLTSSEGRQTLLDHAPASSRSSYFTTFLHGDYKLIYNYTTSSPLTTTNVPLGTYELYNLATDPHEAVNLVDVEPELVMTMARDMVEQLEAFDAPYPTLISDDDDLAAIGLPASSGEDHPVILPEFASVDLDGDGLSDNEEDPNRNGLQDVDETDPENSDSDGDRTNDGGELSLGLDPLDAGSYFYLEVESDVDGVLTLTWPSLPGTTFEIRSSVDLVDWSEIVVSELPASVSDLTTSYELPSSLEARKFYRIGLE
jgi:arylsulfatase A-like enzyme